MSELNFVELPVIEWLTGHPKPALAKGLGWTYRDETRWLNLTAL